MNITGTLMKAFSKTVTVRGENKKVSDIYVESGGTEYKATYWDTEVDKGLLGSTVQVDLKEGKEYQGKPQYSVKSMSVLNDAPSSPTHVTETTASAPVAVVTPKEREEFREDAEEAVINNIKSAQVIVKKAKLKDVAVSDLVLLGDMAGRTLTAIYLDSTKRR